MKKEKNNKFVFGKRVLTLALAALPLAGLGGCKKLELAQVGGIVYEDGVLSFNEVADAVGYNVTFTHKGEVVYTDQVEGTSIDVESLGLEGNISFTVSAYAGEITGPENTYDFAVLTAFSEVVFEAEDNLYNFGTGKAISNFRNNTLASKGAYVGGIDDAGQGIYINYLCPFDGTFTLDSYYLCEAAASQDVWVNGEYQTEFVYTEFLGYGGDTFNTSKATVNVTLKKGWNTISIMKNGDASDDWGGFAEIDYLTLNGSGEKYNVDDLLETYGERPAAYRLEAEMGSPRKKDEGSGLYLCKNPCIADSGASNGFLMGGVEQTYDGVGWHFNSPVKAKYSVKIAYAAGEFDGSTKAKPSFIVTQEEVLLNKNADFADYTKVTMQELPYTGWNNVAVAEETVEIVLEAGKNFIHCLKLSDSGFFQIDYIEITFISEITE